MPQVNHLVQFKAGLYERYRTLQNATPPEIDINTIYFCTDTAQVFVGDIEYSRPVTIGQGEPTNSVLESAPPNSLYYDTVGEKLYTNFSNTWVLITKDPEFIEGELPSLQTTVENENLTIAFSSGRLPVLK